MTLVHSNGNVPAQIAPTEELGRCVFSREQLPACQPTTHPVSGIPGAERDQGNIRRQAYIHAATAGSGNRRCNGQWAGPEFLRMGTLDRLRRIRQRAAGDSGPLARRYEPFSRKHCSPRSRSGRPGRAKASRATTGGCLILARAPIMDET